MIVVAAVVQAMVKKLAFFRVSSAHSLLFLLFPSWSLLLCLEAWQRVVWVGGGVVGIMLKLSTTMVVVVARRRRRLQRRKGKGLLVVVDVEEMEEADTFFMMMVA